MKSMTGYGRGQSGAGGLQFTVEIQSVNRKQADINLNLPRDLAELEPRVRDLANEAVSRGRLNIVVEFTAGSGPAGKLEINHELARSCKRQIEQLQKDLRLTGSITIDAILRLPGVMQVREEKLAAAKAWPHLEAAVRDALDDLNRMRAREGRTLARDLRARLKTIREAAATIRDLHPGVAVRYREALQARLRQSGLDVVLEDERFLREVAYYADRCDISEELTRLDSHVAEFVESLGSAEPVGRRLDFLTQEVSRELNTLGAKANDASISHCVVACKSEMEKIREQVQNIE